MLRERVKSSNLHSVGFSENILEIKFLNNHIYRYYKVPVDVYSSLINAKSKGTFLNDYIKPNFRAKKII